MNAMVLCAGLGTRLRPLSDWCAKPLVPLGDRPALAHVVERLRAAGVGRVVVNAYHRADDVRGFARGQPDVVVSEETEILGTAGGVAHAAALLGEGDVLVHNGDILGEVDLPSLLAAHRADATLVIQCRASGQGAVGVDERGEIVRLRSETVRAGEVRSADFLGVHVLGATLRRRLPARGCLIADVYLPALREGARLVGFPYDGRWFDIGTVPSYLDANMAWLAATGEPRWIAEGAHVGQGACVEASVIGRGAVIAQGARVVRAVVWPNARVTGDVRDAVITPNGVVPRG